ncbi:hypothetical protein K6Y31_00050 [Motilimonas cestriensis]|uniref:Solute-binding protein family 3/N-terminal domain-containing protein n=1 Tax=Motilimonas cestriensis TaxID=2742685 RepID=A0ABS8W639_9GAMM|nr:hypothetical protein [Motilimonas cestriensis]MCE2593211.1 hypothetical protein [Motilimonas cestriensis]
MVLAKYLCRYSALILTLCAFSSTSYGKETITWIEYGLPPVFISSGPHKNQGFANQSAKWLQQRMPQWRHVTKLGAIPRFLSMAKTKHLVCSSVLKNAARENDLYFSKPLQSLSPHRLYFLAKNKAVLETKIGHSLSQIISLEEIMKHLDKLVFAIAGGRSYGDNRDKILDKYRDQMHISTQYKLSSQFITRLLADRVDLIIEYPWIIAYEQTQLNFERDDLASVAIAESAPILEVYIACSKTPAGKAVIDAINQISDAHPESPLQQFVEQWNTATN